MAVKVLIEKFKNHKCPAVAECPVGALTQKDEKTAPVVDETKCIECGLCTTTCLNDEFALET